MKLTSGYMIREIAGNFVVVPVGESVIDYKELLHTNESGAFIFESIRQGMSYEQLLNAMAIKYEANEEEITILQRDLDAFLSEAYEQNLLELEYWHAVNY